MSPEYKQWTPVVGDKVHFHGGTTRVHTSIGPMRVTAVSHVEGDWYPIGLDGITTADGPMYDSRAFLRVGAEVPREPLPWPLP